jgi:hypothetical protein
MKGLLGNQHSRRTVFYWLRTSQDSLRFKRWGKRHFLFNGRAQIQRTMENCNHFCNLPQSIIIKDIDSAVIKSSQKNPLGPDAFIGKFYWTFEEQTNSIIQNLFKNRKKTAYAITQFYEASKIQTPKLDKNTIKEENNSLKCTKDHECKILSKI